MTGRPLIVAIDGPAGAGKSTIAKRVAGSLGIPYLDTGALYRALAFFLDARGIPPVESDMLFSALQEVSLEITGKGILLEGKYVGAEIRAPRIDAIVSAYASLPMVRNRLLDLQREQGKRKGLVADGRDMATVVFPDAQVKIFLTASAEERARRRFLELKERKENARFEDVLEQIRERDRADSSRSAAPLRKADDAVELSTDGLTIGEVTGEVLAIVREILNKENHNDAVQ
ncbi:(d)CMP kinase [Aminivibrio sp.]|jgi:cytidylate kinase|uniref:(d)CMP kinase n=1 Tax=Aminivibrio sp. TaxID=1872489 RepID=UPI001A56DDE4|nr:(d)CMP kinase [Aminivibrio sp.]MBL3538573.1 (d)CMP kinase [Aminivibrio sp.]